MLKPVHTIYMGPEVGSTDTNDSRDLRFREFFYAVCKVFERPSILIIEKLEAKNVIKLTPTCFLSGLCVDR